ncbi:MAG: hypothetical protein AB7V56_13180 [Candidatus Nitrosocosmicus sp.]|jgi:hypothetical protein|uniref:hypothetical protein n=1 Tax=Candidatus Nitrosocosmicus agrestis TaxID=2563600 RepID=UPI00122E6085|nr:hypothetical protein [Candidatus Nitrosocosmicus sp. SS]KAA2281565.1 hypothetical protein F1Z66_07905 [Candidatus Nitrosocosmicus sp. SS]KAF0869768.1 hypothetical protein E5N71_03185 [Candidatus Nitrosocosmicus sp. SS]MDR4490365.1 hypothetical protein [Candidatus Nitrosocosmicus sp.]
MSKSSHIKKKNQNQDRNLIRFFLSLVTSLTILVSCTIDTNVANATQSENQGNFIIRVTLVDDLDNDIDRFFLI